MADSVNLVITEGIFDIIGVYLHFYKDTPQVVPAFVLKCRVPPLNSAYQAHDI